MPTTPPAMHDCAPFLRACLASRPDLVDEFAAIDRLIVHKERSTGREDCRLLYLLVRLFKPRRVLEIGTFVGSTCNAMALACAANDNGATITTIDYDTSGYDIPEQFAPFVTKRDGFSDDVMPTLDGPFDFVFADAVLKPRSIRLLRRLAGPRTILVTHDFTFESDTHLDKGVGAAVLMMHGFAHPLEWFLPGPKSREEKWQPVDVDGTAINACCAWGIPPALIEEAALTFERGREALPSTNTLPPERVHTYKHRGHTVRWVELDDGRLAFKGYEPGLLRRLFG